MRGMVASGIISPIMSPIVSNALEFVLERTGLQKALSEGSKLNNELEEQFLIENYIKAGYGVGVSSGDNDNKTDITNKPKKSRVMFDGRGNPAIDRFIDRTFAILGEKHQESLQESERHKNINSLDLFESRNQEVNLNVSNIRQGQGHVVFKTAGEFNETFGGSLRYLFDQASHTSHVVTPTYTGVVNAVNGTIGHGVAELYQLTLPERAREYLAETYKGMMGYFPTENQRFLVNTTAGMLVGQVTARGLNLGMINKNGSSIQSPKIMPMQQTNTQKFSYQTTNKVIKEMLGDHAIIKGSIRELDALKIQTILKEESRVMAGAGHIKAIKDINRILKSYGGTKHDWAKMTSKDLNQTGIVKATKGIELHWYENIKTGQKIEPKVKKQ